MWRSTEFFFGFVLFCFYMCVGPRCLLRFPLSVTVSVCLWVRTPVFVFLRDPAINCQTVETVTSFRLGSMTAGIGSRRQGDTERPQRRKESESKSTFDSAKVGHDHLLGTRCYHLAAIPRDATGLGGLTHERSKCVSPWRDERRIPPCLLLKQANVLFIIH